MVQIKSICIQQKSNTVYMNKKMNPVLELRENILQKGENAG